LAVIGQVEKAMEAAGHTVHVKYRHQPRAENVGEKGQLPFHVRRHDGDVVDAGGGDTGLGNAMAHDDIPCSLHQLAG
jgi:hypothetical protein